MPILLLLNLKGTIHFTRGLRKYSQSTSGSTSMGSTEHITITSKGAARSAPSSFMQATPPFLALLRLTIALFTPLKGLTLLIIEALAKSTSYSEIIIKVRLTQLYTYVK